MSKKDNNCDWYCDGCGTFMNNQASFTVSSGTWLCIECGYNNDVSEANIRYDDYNNNENLSVGDAALIWLSNGKDEDYMFGYSEEELRDAL